MTTKRTFGEYSYKFDQDEEWEGFITASGTKISPIKTEISDKLKNILKSLESNSEIIEENLNETTSTTKEQTKDKQKRKLLDEDLEDIELLDILPDFIPNTPVKNSEKPPDNSSPKSTENQKNIIYNNLNSSKHTPNKFSTPTPVSAKISPGRKTTIASTQVLKGSPLKTILKSNHLNRKPANAQFKSPLKTGESSNFKTPSKVRKIMYSKNSSDEDSTNKNNNEEVLTSSEDVNENKISNCT